ncbi:MAG: hypothetical protein IJ791_05485 [Lachnospiraceae bacterium]|nr:hypothetical protein [Lachnospiraceae bacterium]
MDMVEITLDSLEKLETLDNQASEVEINNSVVVSEDSESTKGNTEEKEIAFENMEITPETLDTMSEGELKKMKLWLFTENVRVATEKKNMEDMRERFIEERTQFQEEMKTLNQAILQSRKRLKQEEQFFTAKMQILQNGFAELEMDRKELEREKKAFEAEKALEASRPKQQNFLDDADVLFAGVNSPMALKKRYRDLLKIYHPDNVAGDSRVVLVINQEYERLSSLF